MASARREEEKAKAWVETHTKHLTVGVLAVLVPLAVLFQSLSHHQKNVKKLLTDVSKIVPKATAETVGFTVVVLLVLLLICWLLGWFVSRTSRGQQLLEWERAKFASKSPFLQKQAKKKGEPAPPPIRPAFAFIGGVWEPGAIVEEASGWASVFIPNIPDTSTGRLVLIPDDQVHRLEASGDEFHAKLREAGAGSGDWLAALVARGEEAGR